MRLEREHAPHQRERGSRGRWAIVSRALFSVVTVCLMALSGHLAWAQEQQAEDLELVDGFLEGNVTSRASGRPLQGAIATFRGEGVERFSKSDANGEFAVELPSGKYQLTLDHPQFDTEIYEIEIVGGASLARNFLIPSTDSLDPSTLGIEEVVVIGTYNGSKDKARWSDKVVDVLSAEDFSVTGASNAVDALARVTGVTVVGGKFVYVRGLGERYSNTTFNGALLPSPDPLRRVIPLDLFPTGVLEEVEVQKTYSATAFGDFSGGAVGLVTRRAPEQLEHYISGGWSGNTQTTLQDALRFRGGGNEFTGRDDGFRDLPDVVNDLGPGLAEALNTPEGQNLVAQSFDQTFDTSIEALPVNFNVEGAIGNSWNIGDKGARIGFRLGSRYANGWQFQSETFQQAQTLTEANPRLQANPNNGDDENLSRTENTIDFSTLLSVEGNINDANLIRSTTFLTRRTDIRAIRQFAFDENRGNQEDFVESIFEFEERQLFAQQFNGEHFFAEARELEVNWFVSIAEATRGKPDTRSFIFERPEDSPAGTPFELSDDQGSLLREFEDLTDQSFGAGVDFTLPFTFGENGSLDLKLGASYNAKDRVTDNIRFEFITSQFEDRALFESIRPQPIEDILIPENIGEDLIEIQLNSRNTPIIAENYTGSEDLIAGFIEGNFNLGLKWQLTAGVRAEAFNISSEPLLDSFSQIAPPPGELETLDLLPALTVTYAINDAMQIRVGASRTVNRPDLREIGPIRFVDPINRYTLIGNPDIEQASIVNLDARWEWYFGESDSLQVAFFYKDFTDPIEIEVIPGAQVLRRPINADSAVNQGVELAFRKQLDFGDIPVLRDIYLKFNGALIDSNVTLPSSVALFESDGRALQGQSEWVVNAQLTYENFNRDITASLLFNLADDRIIDVGTDDLPTSREDPPARLDFLYRQGFDLFNQRFIVSLSARNLLDQDISVVRGQVIERQFNIGRSFSLGVSLGI